MRGFEAGVTGNLRYVRTAGIDSNSLACQELEVWYWGDLAAVSEAYGLDLKPLSAKCIDENGLLFHSAIVAPASGCRFACAMFVRIVLI